MSGRREAGGARMTAPIASLVAVLVAAHVLGDFVLQTTWDVANRRRPIVLLRHTFLHALLAYILTGLWTFWPLPAAIFITHTLIDAVKTRRGESARVFVIDQCAHLAVVVVLSVWMVEARVWPGGWLLHVGPAYARILLLGAGYIAAVEAGSHLITALVRPYLDELEGALASADTAPLRPARGLTNAGRVIGRLERTLVFLLVLVNQAAGIGFLVAAKSIFRFGELRDRANRMESEYIIIGTLASFAYAIAVAYAVKELAAVIG